MEGDSSKKQGAGKNTASFRAAWRNWGDHPLVAVITVIAGIAAILGYIDERNDRRSAANRPGDSSAVSPQFADVGRLPGEATPNTKAQPPNDMARGQCADIAGRWDWLNTGGVVAIAETNTMMWYRVATDPLPTVTGTWDCDRANPRRITLRWMQTGLVDTMVLSRDGRRITGANTQNGFKLSGVRAR